MSWEEGAVIGRGTPKYLTTLPTPQNTHKKNNGQDIHLSYLIALLPSCLNSTLFVDAQTMVERLVPGPQSIVHVV